MAKDSVFNGALGWDDWIWWCAIGGAGLLFLLLILCAVVCSQRAKRKGREEVLEEIQQRQREQMRQDEANRRFVEQQGPPTGVGAPRGTNVSSTTASYNFSKPTSSIANTSSLHQSALRTTQTNQPSGYAESMHRMQSQGYNGVNRGTSSHASFNHSAAYVSYDNSEVPYNNLTSPHIYQHVPGASRQTTTLKDRIDALRQANDVPRRESFGSTAPSMTTSEHARSTQSDVVPDYVADHSRLPQPQGFVPPARAQGQRGTVPTVVGPGLDYSEHSSYSTSSDRSYDPETFATARGPTSPLQEQQQGAMSNSGGLDAAEIQYGMVSSLKGRIPADERSGHLSNSQASVGQFDDADSSDGDSDSALNKKSISRVSVEF